MYGQERTSSLSFLLLQGHGSHQQGWTLMTSSKPNHLPKAWSPHTIPLGVQYTYGEEHKHVVYNNYQNYFLGTQYGWWNYWEIIVKSKETLTLSLASSVYHCTILKNMKLKIFDNIFRCSLHFCSLGNFHGWRWNKVFYVDMHIFIITF